MEQHPVPQHIASFEFKLFGPLTIRQFISLAVPMGIAALIFFSNVANLIKFPLAGIFAVIGLVIALVPINGRPFDKWFVAFIKAIMAPTQRVWIKEAKLPEFLRIIVSLPSVVRPEQEVVTGADRSKLRAYLRSLPQEEQTPFDVKEKMALEKLDLGREFAGVVGRVQPLTVWTGFAATESLPQIEPSIVGRKQRETLEHLPPIYQAPQAQEATGSAPLRMAPAAKPYILPGVEKRLPKREIVHKARAPKMVLASELNPEVEYVIPIQTSGRRVRLLAGIGKTRARKLHFAPPAGFDLSKLPIRGERRFEVSEELKRRFNIDDLSEVPPQSNAAGTYEVPQAEQKAGLQEVQATSTFKSGALPQKPVNINASGDVSLKAEEKEDTTSKISIHGKKFGFAPPSETFSPARIVPLTNMPNVISGLISKSDGSPAVGAILTVYDVNGIPVRALKTNKLGQFLSVTSLTSGQYRVEIESQDVQFNPVSINLTGQVMAPLEIVGKGGAKK